MALPVLLLSATPFFAGAWRSLRQRRLGMDVPVSLGIAVTFAASSAATFHPGGWLGHEVYFDSMTMFVAFLLGARYLDLRARNRAALQLESALHELPQLAYRLNAQGVAEPVSAQRLQRGDLVLVPLGQAFPADGQLIEGATAADESMLSGESHPVDKPCGAAVVAGSVNLGAPVRMRVDRVGDDTAWQAVLALMREASTQRPALARWVPVAVRMDRAAALALGPGAHTIGFAIEQDSATGAPPRLVEKSTFVVPR